MTTEPERRALLVEDDPDQLELLACMLRSNGWDVIEARNGVHLLEWVQKVSSPGAPSAFEVIVSDINMPGLSAIEVFAGWKYGGWPAPLVLVTASGDHRLLAEAGALGAAAVLTKPVSAAALHEALDRALRDGAGATEKRRMAC